MNYLASAALAISLGSATIFGIAITPAQADANAAVCAQGYGKFDGILCNFANYDQCRASVSGTPATCIDNPYRRAAQNQSVRPRAGRQ